MNKLRLVTFDTSANYRGLKTFDCGNDMINIFVKKSLKKRVKKHLSQAYVLLDENDSFVGFYTLDTFSLSRENFENEGDRTGLPPIVPVIKLAMLGVEKKYQNRGIGKRLLRDAMLRVARISVMAGCTGIYLLAEEGAVPFYEKLGFITLKNDIPTPMFLSIEVILDAVK